MYWPGLPLRALSMANAYENGNAIISPRVINSIPITTIPIHVLKFKISRLKVTSNKPIIT